MAFEIVKIGTDKYTEVLADAHKSYNCSPNFAVRAKSTGKILADIHFQDGPIKEVGINGVANEDLIVMVMHRLRQFQDTDYACKENEETLQLGRSLSICFRRLRHALQERRFQGPLSFDRDAERRGD